MGLDEVIELYKTDIRWIQENRRGRSINQCNLYKVLDKNNIEYGIDSYYNGRFSGGGHRADMGVRRDLFRESNIFWILIDGDRVHLPNDRELWDEVVGEITRDKRIEKISEVLDIN